jgi:hypothetical protein
MQVSGWGTVSRWWVTSLAVQGGVLLANYGSEPPVCCDGGTSFTVGLLVNFNASIWEQHNVAGYITTCTSRIWRCLGYSALTLPGACTALHRAAGKSKASPPPPKDKKSNGKKDSKEL